ncbi:MBL fold metallo-hydrolase [Pseudarthrobacter sp. NS4]|uniref:MBL fold metallo-hydrolase n=1 Tax=Pseudarthrobacter sp. NS4 TaxID=2973976 RepID=UPI002163783B|nr:MBL fold metallo-hydrolase [Pseudarthrobacter sp. NS4]
MVPHGAAYPALAYRFDTDHGSVVFSGDTAVSSNLIRLAQGADLLVHEAVELESSAARMGWNETTMKHMREVHTDVAEIGRIARDSGVRAVALTHLVPDAFAHREWEQALKNSARNAGFTGGTHVCQELQDVPLSRLLR